MPASYNWALTSLSIVIPAFNEERRLGNTLERVRDYLTSREFGSPEVLVVDDGSRDGTAALVVEFASKHPPFRLLRNPGNRGKGFAVRHGMLEATGAWRLFSDADLSAPIEELDPLLRAVIDQKAQVAIGSRALDRSKIRVHQPAAREYSGRVFNWIMRGITGLPFADTQCGFKLYSADAAQRIFSRQQLDGFSFDVEDLVIASVQNLKVVEIPVEWSNSEGSTVSMAKGMKSFLDLLEIRRYARSGRYR